MDYICQERFCREKTDISRWSQNWERAADLEYFFQNCNISERIWKEENIILPYIKSYIILEITCEFRNDVRQGEIFRKFSACISI